MFLQELDHNTVENIKYVCKLIFDVLKIPTYFLDNVDDIFFSYSHSHDVNPLLSNKKELFENLFENCSSYDYPIIRSTDFLENYVGINLKIDEHFLGRFVIGPSTYVSVNTTTVDTLISDHQISLRYKRELINYYASIPTIDYRRLISISQLLYHLIYSNKLDVFTVIEDNSSPQNLSQLFNNDYEYNLSQNRKNFFWHHTLTSERKLLTCIREGNIEKLKKEMQNPLDGEYGILSKNNPIRHHKNLAICLVTLATRMAIEGGMNTELAYTLSDSYIQRIEEIDDTKDLYYYRNKILYDFTNKVHAAKKLSYSKPIILCQNHIFNHLYEDISLSQLANLVYLTPNYLSELFKKEVGISISCYIQQERIEDAKKLLTTSTYSLLEISTLLRFHDQSHFTKVFKKFTGITPKKYRDQRY